MPRPPRALLAFLIGILLGTAAHADHAPLNLSYQRINLTNGRVLKDVTLNSINRETGLIYVLDDRRLRPYPLALFPRFVTDRINALAAEHPPAKPRENSPANEVERTAASPAPDSPFDTSPAAIADCRCALR